MLYSFNELLLLFFTYAFLGWCVETTGFSLAGKRFRNRGFVSAPFCMMYGIMGIAVTIVFKDLRGSVVILFLGVSILCTTIQWLVGLLLERVGNGKWWDYSRFPMNFNGYVSLPVSAVLGGAGTLAILFFNDLLLGVYRMLPNLLRTVVMWILLGMAGLDLLVSFLSFLHIGRKSRLVEWNDRLKSASNSLGGRISEMVIQRIMIAYPNLQTQRMKGYEISATISGGTKAEHVEGSMPKDSFARAAAETVKTADGTASGTAETTDGIASEASKTIDGTAAKTEKEANWTVVEAGKAADVTAVEAGKTAGETAAAGKRKTLRTRILDIFSANPNDDHRLTYRELFWIFVIGALLGDVLETIFMYLTRGRWMSRSSLVWGMFSIVWGGALVLGTLLLHRDRNRSDSYLFLAGTLIGGTYEYICSVFTELVFGAVFWDYSHIPFNIAGRVNLLYCFFWGIAAVIWIKKLYPLLHNLLAIFYRWEHWVATSFIALFMAADILISCGALIRYDVRSYGIPPKSGIGIYLDKIYDDAAMEKIYPGEKRRQRNQIQ